MASGVLRPAVQFGGSLGATLSFDIIGTRIGFGLLTVAFSVGRTPNLGIELFGTQLCSFLGNHADRARAASASRPRQTADRRYRLLPDADQPLPSAPHDAAQAAAAVRRWPDRSGPAASGLTRSAALLQRPMRDRRSPRRWRHSSRPRPPVGDPNPSGSCPRLHRAGRWNVSMTRPWLFIECADSSCTWEAKEARS